MPIGPAARHLNRDVDLGDGITSQLAAWLDLGLIDELPRTAYGKVVKGDLLQLLEENKGGREPSR